MSEETSKRDLRTGNETGQASVEKPFIATQEIQKKWSQLVTRAWADESLKQRLLKDPAPLLREQGIEIPAGFDAQVVQDKNTITCLLQPQMLAGELTPSLLSGVVGGRAASSSVKYMEFQIKDLIITSFPSPSPSK